jgi:hypothetical protein
VIFCACHARGNAPRVRGVPSGFFRPDVASCSRGRKEEEKGGQCSSLSLLFGCYIYVAMLASWCGCCPSSSSLRRRRAARRWHRGCDAITQTGERWLTFDADICLRRRAARRGGAVSGYRAREEERKGENGETKGERLVFVLPYNPARTRALTGFTSVPSFAGGSGGGMGSSLLDAFVLSTVLWYLRRCTAAFCLT